MTNYTLKVKNNSSNATSFCVFMALPEEQAQNSSFYTLAWMVKYAEPNTMIRFSWSDIFNVIWSQPGRHLQSGVICDVREPNFLSLSRSIKINAAASQCLNINPPEKGCTTLQYNKKQPTYCFSKLEKSNNDQITINCDSEVPNSKTTSPHIAAGIGIGLSGSGLFLVNTQPNLAFMWPVPPFKFYLSFGSVKWGEIIDRESWLERAVLVSFNDTTECEAILNINNRLKVIR